MIEFNLDDDASAGSEAEMNVINDMSEIRELPFSSASGLASFSKIFPAVSMGARPEQPESPVDPMLLVSEQFRDVPEDEPNELLSLMNAPIVEPSKQPIDAPLVHSFSDTSLTSFPFPELALTSFALQSYCLFQWYKLWDVPAPALKPHMSEAWNPCSNPITLDEINAPLLRKFPYIVSTKTNGIRVQLMVIRHPVTFQLVTIMVDRNMGMYDIGIACLNGCDAVGTLLDGELVERTDGKWAFILFDVVAVRG
jgi:mRNA capping enzyme, catalytic domain/mRNA capping enzyme, C-terminal domain